MFKSLDERIRQSLRLDPQLWAAIDLSRRGRAGNISRNTWITEAILEKVAREGTGRDIPISEGGRRA